MTGKLKIDKKLDLTAVCCPVNFIKVRLALEELEKGQILELILDDGESICNVPRSVKEDGHQIVKVENFGRQFKILVKKQ